jgi:hypothetical protein
MDNSVSSAVRFQIKNFIILEVLLSRTILKMERLLKKVQDMADTRGLGMNILNDT